MRISKMSTKVQICSFFLSALCATLFLGTTLASQPAEARSVTYNLDIPAQNLNDALQAFALASQHKLLYSSVLVEGKRSPALKGQFTTEQAVKALLSGTRLDYEVTSDGLVLIRAEEQPPHTGGAPAVSGEDSNGGNSSAQEGKKSSSGGFRVAQVDQGKGSGVSSVGNQNSNSQEHSNSPSTGLAEIIVTAQKKSERLQDVPVPVTAISGDTLVNANQLRLEDYYTRIPGLGLALTGNGDTPAVTIRGITTGGATNTTVGTVVDEVPYGATVNPGITPAPPDIDPGDLARIEVLRGPQGTLYGASSIGGLIKFVTVDPSTSGVSGSIQTGITNVDGGSDLGHSVRGSVNVPLSETFAVRASGFTVRDPGYIYDVQTGEHDINREYSNGGHVSALWRPSEDFSLKLSALAQESNRVGTQDVNALLGGLRQNTIPGTGLYGRKTQLYSAVMTGKLGSVALTSVTGYSNDNVISRADLSTSLGALLAYPDFGVTGVAAPLSQQTKKFTQELRASVPIGERINWLIGAFYTDERLATDLNYLAANVATGATVGSLLSIYQPVTYDEYAAFTNVTFDVTDRFDIQLGGRLSENRQSFSSVRTGPGAILFYGSNPSFVPESHSKDTPLTYLLTPQFKFSPDLMAYARVASGYRPGSPNANCGPNVPCQSHADTTENYEIGVKGDALDRILSFDASLYYIDWRDVQISLRNPAGTVVYTANAGRAKSEGVELSAELKPMTGMTIAAWIAYDNAVLTQAFPANSTAYGVPGDRLPYSSPFSGNFSVDQEFPLSRSVTGHVSGSFSYVDNRKGIFGSKTQVRETFPAYTQTDLRAGLRYESWTLDAFVTNVTDERGILRSGLDSLHPNYVTYIQPRTVGLLLTKKF